MQIIRLILDLTATGMIDPALHAPSVDSEFYALSRIPSKKLLYMTKTYVDALCRKFITILTNIPSHE